MLILIDGARIMKKCPRPADEMMNGEEGIAEYYVVTDELDLHGFFPEQVPEMVDEFIKNARTLGLKRLRIIHGKGKSRLKHTVHTALAAHPAVASFIDAAPECGGWGATVVVLH